jgi:hypothetical protein
MKSIIWASGCLAVGALGLAVACTSSGNSGNGPAASGAWGNLVTAYCNKFFECSPEATTQEFADVATCISRTSLSVNRFDQLPGTSWTTSKIEGCAAVISSSSCQSISEGISSDACKSEPGTLANGTPCGDDSQCAGGNCNTSTSSDGGVVSQSTFCGKCETRTPSTCGDAGACTSTEQCSYDTVSRSSRCVTPAPEGSACSDGMPCVSGLTCSNSICSKRVGKGAPCTNGSDCDSSLGLSCIDMTCQLPAHVGPGEACDYPSPRCSTGSECVYMGLVDGGSSSVCVTRAADNALCDESKGPRCTSPARCLSGVCTVPDYAQCK